MFDQNINTPNFDYDTNVVGNNNVFDNDTNVDINMVGYGNQMSNQNVNGMNIDNYMNQYNDVHQQCVHRTFVHEVPHVCPIHTRIINHHIYKHTYRPEYTCSEENVVSNVQCGSCCQFR